MSPRLSLLVLACLLAVISSGTNSFAKEPGAGHTPSATPTGDELLDAYFERRTREIEERTFAEIRTLEDWTSRRDEYRRQLLEMLGLDPMPERSPLEPVIEGTIDEDEFVVERLHFQSMPGLYVTGNLYRPKQQEGPLPAVLYVCGHGQVKIDGVSYGNKTHYQHHGAWFARNGYVCLVIDTIQLGEIEGEHHGTYRLNKWWWNSRGYTPAGVEAWNCVRAIDYLQSRPEVDAKKIGVTGRSGGGAYSWWAAAIDERIGVAVPVAGITSMRNHVVDDCVEGHCDCMYMVNTYRWDFAMVAALVAPRPLLISNTDKDGIFPLEGVVDVHQHVRQIYKLYNAEKNLGLHITEGPHEDTQELHIHAFRWFNRFLKQDNSLIEKTATNFFTPQQLKVFATLPSDERVTSIDESFVPAAEEASLPTSLEEFGRLAPDWIQTLRAKSFAAWPSDDELLPLDVEVVATKDRDQHRVSYAEYTSDATYRLALYMLEPLASTESESVEVRVLDQAGWESVAGGLATVMPNRFAGVTASEEAWQALVKSVESRPVVYAVPRGIGPTEWTGDPRKLTHIRRRFMLLGETLASVQVFDIRRALPAIGHLVSAASKPRDLTASGETATLVLYASLFEPRIGVIRLDGLASSYRESPDLLNATRVLGLAPVVLMAGQRAQRLELTGVESSSWQNLFAPRPWANAQLRTP